MGVENGFMYFMFSSFFVQIIRGFEGIYWVFTKQLIRGLYGSYLGLKYATTKIMSVVVKEPEVYCIIIEIKST